jgi:ABC-type nitrate/sulfonate/bicarbonate transport system substrate-binding protein
MKALRKHGGICVSLIAAILLLGVSTANAADRVRVGLSSVSPINGSVWVAEEKGLFRKYGLEAEVILIGGASAAGVGNR